MRTKLVGIAVLIIVLGAPLAGAAKSHTQAWTITIKAQNPDSSAGNSPGQCTQGAGLAALCPGSDSCNCYTSTGTATGSAGNASVTVYETFDNTTEVIEEGNVLCTAAYFDIEVTGKQDTESIGGFGGDCYVNTGGGFTPVEFAGGGCQLHSSSKLFAGGLGSCKGTYGAAKNGSFPLSFKISGTALKVK